VEQVDRWEGAIRAWNGRLDIGWGGEDRISGEPVLAALLALHPTATVTRWPDLGHYPQIEDPTTVGRLAARFISDSVGEALSHGDVSHRPGTPGLEVEDA
jgi:pimeloyl-ACP methyl ester carboxylesterase